MPVRMRRVALAALLLLASACSGADPEPVEPAETRTGPLRLTAALTQDSRDTVRDRIAVVVTNEEAEELTPDAIEYADPRLSGRLVAGRLRTLPPGGERRFPLPLLDPVCDAASGEPGRLLVRVGSEEVAVAVGDEVGVVDRWVDRRCAELAVHGVAPLEFTEVRVAPGGGRADLVLTATPTGEEDGAYVLESVAGTPVFTSAGEPWAPGVTVAAGGDPVTVPLRARPARCDGHVFGEAAGATAFLVGVRLNGERLEVLVRMSPEVAATALDFAVEACRARG